MLAFDAMGGGGLSTQGTTVRVSFKEANFSKVDFNKADFDKVDFKV